MFIHTLFAINYQEWAANDFIAMIFFIVNIKTYNFFWKLNIDVSSGQVYMVITEKKWI